MDMDWMNLESIEEWQMLLSFITLIVVIINIFLTFKSSNRGRIVSTVVSERIKWLQELREQLVIFNTSIYEDDYSRAFNAYNHISLLLKNTEYDANNLLSAMKKDLDKAKLAQSNFHSGKDSRKKDNENILFLERRILKSEWKRIVKEAKKGKVLSGRKVERIYKKMARELDTPDFNAKKAEKGIKKFEKKEKNRK